MGEFGNHFSKVFPDLPIGFREIITNFLEQHSKYNMYKYNINIICQ